MADFSQNLAYPLAASVLLGIILSVVAVFIVTLNVISVYTFATNQSLRSFSDRFIFSLACSDTGVGICACVRVIMTMLGTHWPWNYNFCLQFNTWEIWTNFSTEMNSFVIALNCYFQLTSPDAYIRRQSPGLQKAIITAVWTTVFLFFALPILIWDSIMGRDPTVNQEGSCSYPFAHNIPFSLYFLFVPLSFIAGGPVTNIFTTFIHKRVYRQQLIDILHPHKDKVVEIMTRLELGDNEDLVQRVRDATHLLLQADFAMKARNKVKGPESRPKAKHRFKIIGEKSSSSSSVSSSMSSSLVVAASSSKPASPGSLQLKVGMLTRNSMMVTPGKTGNLFVKSQSNTTSNNVISNAKTAESEGSIITLIFPSSKDTRDATKEAENRTQAIEEVIGALRRCQITNQEFILAQAINFVETCCCTPFVSLGMLATLCDLYPSLNCAGAFPPWLLHMSLWLVMVNSGINPILYYTFDQKYQTALLETLIKIGIRRPAISNLPGEEPSNQPPSQPINQPDNEPSNQPSSEPINQPANEPANQPSSQPTNQPAIEPNNEQRNVPATT